MLLRARRYDERNDVLFRLEARGIGRGSRLRRKWTDAHPVPGSAARNVRLDDVRLVPADPQLLSKRVGFLVRLERAHLKLVVAVVPGLHGLRLAARLRFARGLRQPVARMGDDR